MSAVGLRVLFAALLASAAFAQTTVSNACGQTFKVGDLVFTLPSLGTTPPSAIYYNVADLATKYQLALSNISAFNSSGQSFSFANTTFSSWTWNWDCSLSCTNVSNTSAVSISNITFGGLVNPTLAPLNSNNTNITTTASDMCFFIYNGSNGQADNQSLSITLIGTAFAEQNGTGVLAFSARFTGPLVATLLHEADSLLLDFNYSCLGSGNLTNCSDVTTIGNVRADIAGNHSRSVFNLANHTVALNGPNVTACSLIAGLNTTSNTCGLSGFNISVEDNVTVVSFQWDATQIVGFDTIFFDSRIYTLALNVTGNGTTPTPTPTPTPSPTGPSFSRCFCNTTNELLIDAILNMTNLWDDNTMFTRLVVEETVFNSNISNNTLTRLYQNTKDLGSNFGIFYCEDNGVQYATILRRQVDAELANLTALLGNVTNGTGNVTNGTGNVTQDSALEFAKFWNAVNPFAVTDEVYNLTTIRFIALSDLMSAIKDEDSSAAITQQDAFSKATRDMVAYLLQAFRFQRLLRCSSNQCDSLSPF